MSRDKLGLILEICRKCFGGIEERELAAEVLEDLLLERKKITLKQELTRALNLDPSYEKLLNSPPKQTKKKKKAKKSTNKNDLTPTKSTKKKPPRTKGSGAPRSTRSVQDTRPDSEGGGDVSRGRG